MFFESNEEEKSKKTEKDFKELMIRIHANKLDLEKYYHSLSMTPEEFETLMHNPANFTQEEWEWIVQTREALHNAEQKIREGVPNLKSKKKPIVQQNWLFCR